MIKDSLDLIQKAWVLQAMILLLYMMFAWWLMPPDRLAVMAQMLPQIVMIIGGQGVAAAAGPEVKRLIELKAKQKEENNDKLRGLTG
jgi:hypothetical protein